ncbi:hypothetical protein Dsin_002386 [Dipteronia sinensis]|uniref:Uncharacterized protein n=1 Tax=Dipteronia sinensis TaxID=43782 RepID=A0AAE0B6Y6_9ROSI|nr:hypothetical protein Dsin_002386 [Dipteronia sinensis]
MEEEMKFETLPNTTAVDSAILVTAVFNRITNCAFTSLLFSIKASKDINRYYGTTSYDKLKKGIPVNRIFKLYNSELAATLGRNIDNKGVWNLDVHLRRSKLERNLAFWLIYISHSLRPSLQRTKTVLEVAQIMYCIKHQLQIDVGQQISDAIYRIEKKNNLILLFSLFDY